MQLYRDPYSFAVVVAGVLQGGTDPQAAQGRLFIAMGVSRALQGGADLQAEASGGGGTADSGGGGGGVGAGLDGVFGGKALLRQALCCLGHLLHLLPTQLWATVWQQVRVSLALNITERKASKI